MRKNERMRVEDERIEVVKIRKEYTKLIVIVLETSFCRNPKVGRVECPL